MRLPATLTAPRLLIALLLLHAVPLVVTLYRQELFNLVLPFTWVLALPCVLYLLWRQRHSQWCSNERKTTYLKFGLTVALVFCLLTLLNWFVAQMSLQIQPVIFSAQDEAILASLPANETLAFVLRNSLQAWLLVMGIALAYNMLPKLKTSGFLSKRFDKLAIVAWLFDWVVYIGMLLAVFCVMTFFVVNFTGTVLSFFDITMPLMPMISLIVFGMTFFMLNHFSRFSKKLTQKAKTQYSFAGILFRQTGFVILAWFIATALLHMLPMNFLYEMHKPVYFEGLNIERYMKSWTFFVQSWPFFVAPVLGVYMAKCAEGLKVTRSILLLALVPAVFAAFVLSLLPSVQQAFMHWQPLLNMHTIPLDDFTGVFHVSMGSLVFIGCVGVLLLAMRCSKRFSQALVVVMPDRHGRREYRSRQSVAHFFGFFAGFLMVYLILGVYGVFFTAAVYFLSVLSAIILLYCKGMTYKNSKSAALKLAMPQAVS